MEKTTELERLQLRLQRAERSLNQILNSDDETLEQHVLYLRESISLFKNIIESYGNS